MAHSDSINESWSAESINFSANDPCGAVQPTFPYKACNLPKDHSGAHCNKVQAGIRTVEVWWQ